MPGPLSNDRHERFCQKLVTSPTWDVRQSYEDAGYAARGDSARAAGARLLQNDTVLARIAELQAERSERTGVEADAVLKGLLREANGEGPDTNSAARIAALDKLAKHLGLYEKDNTQQKPDAPPQVIVIGGKEVSF